MGHPYPLREIARQAGVSEATVDRVLNHRGNVRASTEREVHQAIADLERQESQLRLNGRTFVVDIVTARARCSSCTTSTTTTPACSATGICPRCCITT